MGSIDHLQQKHQTALNTPREFNMEPENDTFQKDVSFPGFLLQLPCSWEFKVSPPKQPPQEIRPQKGKPTVTLFLGGGGGIGGGNLNSHDMSNFRGVTVTSVVSASVEVDRSSGSHEARRVSELRSELWGVSPLEWCKRKVGGNRVQFVFCSEFLDHAQNENVNIGLHEMAQMVWKSMVLFFIVFFVVLGAFGKFLGTQVIGSKFKWTTQKLVNFNSFSKPAELQHPMFWRVVCDHWNVFHVLQGTIYSSFQRQVIDIQNAKTGHHGKVIQYIKKDCATWKCNMKGNWWNHGNTAEWGEHNFPSLVLGTVCKFVEKITKWYF